MVVVRYVDGTQYECEEIDWPALPGEGVDEIAIGPPWTHLSGQSLYWLYSEGTCWVMGGAPAGYGHLPPEVIRDTSGLQVPRAIKFMPDLRLETVKLGWWWEV